MALVFHGQLKSGSVTGGKQGFFIVISVLPYGADRMDDILGGQIVPRCDDRFPGFAVSDAVAFDLKLLRSGCGKDRPADPAAPFSGDDF